MVTATLRPELKDLPARIQRLPLDARGYPVPKFVAWIDGEPEFRAMSPEYWLQCIQQKICWVCGEKLGVYFAFVLGPMCGISRTTSEPPCHLECARWSARYCPFLTRPEARRREGDERAKSMKGNTAGCPIHRNPGVALVWIARFYKVFNDGNGRPLIEVGEPLGVEWFAEGRHATRAEVQASVDSGLPILEEFATHEGNGAMKALALGVSALQGLLPKE